MAKWVVEIATFIEAEYRDEAREKAKENILNNQGHIVQITKVAIADWNQLTEKEKEESLARMR